jgi:GTPase
MRRSGSPGARQGLPDIAFLYESNNDILQKKNYRSLFLPKIDPTKYHFPDRSGPKELGTPFKRIVIVQMMDPGTTQSEADEQFEEVSRLVETLDGEVVGRFWQRRKHPHAEYCIGPGKADSVGAWCDEVEADTVVFDHPLTPKQITNLEYETGSHVMDRTELILEIFARRAKTAEAKMQVELAYLDFFHPKMDKSTQVRAYRGGIRGFGESALGKKIRAGRARAEKLRQKIEKMQKNKRGRSSRRQGVWTVALVGYTNAGKSTLLNALTDEEVYADDRLFATLDTTTRRVYLGEDKMALFSDTVGFIRRLPHELVASFHSTLEEALSADLLLHVADASSSTLEQQMKAVEDTLKELDEHRHDILIGFNKIDRADPETLAELRLLYPQAVFFSAKTGQGLDCLKEKVKNFFRKNSEKYGPSTVLTQPEPQSAGR